MMKQTIPNISSFANRFGKKRKEKEKGKQKQYLLHLVILKVYDAPGATNLNRRLYRLGLGRYFSTVSVHGAEYVFMANTNGIRRGHVNSFARENDLNVRKEIIRLTAKTAAEVQQEIDILAAGGFGSDADYDGMANNCNHFSDKFCRALTGKGIPRWVNRINATTMLEGVFDQP